MEFGGHRELDSSHILDFRIEKGKPNSPSSSIMNVLKFALLIVGVSSTLLGEKELTLSEQLAQLQKQHAEMKTEMESYRELVMKTGGEREQLSFAETTESSTTTTGKKTPTSSFAEVEESSDDPTIQCQTICKFVKPSVAAGN
jgi:hypothetical protein